MHVYIKGNGVRELGAKPKPKPKSGLVNKKKGLYDYPYYYPGCYPGYFPLYYPPYYSPLYYSDYYSPYNTILDDNYDNRMTNSFPKLSGSGNESLTLMKKVAVWNTNASTKLLVRSWE
jgi:hypothetical protein